VSKYSPTARGDRVAPGKANAVVSMSWMIFRDSASISHAATMRSRSASLSTSTALGGAASSPPDPAASSSDSLASKVSHLLQDDVR
jgi:hypothetical protein